MNKKILIIILFLLIIIFLLVFVKVTRNVNTSENIEKESPKITYEQDTLTGEYIIYNENGEVITRVTEKAEIKIYEDNPDYNPMLLPVGFDEGNNYIITDE